MRILPIALLVLLPAAASAQVDATLPDAPRPVLVTAIDTGRSFDAALQIPGRPDPQGPAAFAEPLPGSDREPVGDQTAFAPMAAIGTETLQPWGVQSAQGFQLNLNGIFAGMDRPAAVSVSGVAESTEHYHWKGLLWQSFAFFGMENSYRLVTDYYFRHLLADAPFWQNYADSMGQWNMRRWSDGDDFLVAYIGHPMQGSVTEFIEIQNDPHARLLRIDDGRPYWNSLFKSFLWNTAYSTDQKIGPLGESALGSEGGYTYALHCQVPCKSYKPGLYQVTNNTGWVKLVSTPVVGTLWTLAEDFLDRYISDPLQNHIGPDKLFPELIRSGLNPCRSMANFLRWRAPWYRDFQHDIYDMRITRRVNFLPSDDAVVRAAPRFELFPHFNAISLPVNTASCFRCRQTTTGFGVGFASRLTRRVDFDSDLNYLAGASPLPSDRAGGSIVMGTFGLRSGFVAQHFAVKGSLRPGFLSYSRAYETSPAAGSPTPNIGRITHFTTALALNADLDISRHFVLRGVFGNTPVRYRENYRNAPDPGTEPNLIWLSRNVFLTNENWSYQAGPVLRF